MFDRENNVRKDREHPDSVVGMVDSFGLVAAT
jgi:hypothetical protein